MKKVKIVIIDDHPSVRYGIKSILSKEPGFNVIAEYENAASFLAEKFTTTPDIIILDISLPDASGISIIEKTQRNLPESKIIMLSMYCRADYIFQAIQKGVSGYVTKETPPENLILGIHQVMRDEYYFDRQAMSLIINRLSEKPLKVFNHSDGNYNRLTAREQEILRLLAQGFTPQEIAEKLCISKRTIENYRTNILKKLELQHSIELVYYAQKIGVI